MAEVVELKIQRMVHEFEDLEMTELITSEERKILIQKRRAFEYKLAKTKKTKQDFVNCILFEIHFLELIDLRRKKIRMFAKNTTIEKSIIQRVSDLLRFMTRLWPSEKDIWDLRISFLISQKQFTLLPIAFMEQVKFLGHLERVWIEWARWEIESHNDFSKARSILLSKAPLYHPNSLSITKEYFRLELLYIEFLNKGQKASNVDWKEYNASDDEDKYPLTVEYRTKVLECAVPEIIYENSQSEFYGNVEFFIEFYNLANKFPFAHKLRNKIYNDLVVKFPNTQSFWRLKAKMLLEGFPLQTSLDKTSIETTEQCEHEQGKQHEDEKQTPDKKIKEALSLYDEALSTLGPSFFDFLFQDLFYILYQVWAIDKLVSMVTHKLIEVFEANASQLKASHFLIWHHLATYLKEGEVKLKRITDLAYSTHSTCPYIKLLSLPYTLKNETMAKKLEIIDNLKGKCKAEICMMIISLTKTNLQKALYNRACSHVDPLLSEEMRLKKMEALSEGKDMLDKCRSHYDEYCLCPPYSIHMHGAMLQKELSVVSVSLDRTRRIFDIALDQFGCSDTGLWLCYIGFEKIHGDMKRVSQLSQDVEMKLLPQFFHEYIDCKFALEACLSQEIATHRRSFIIDCPDEECVDSAKNEFWTFSNLPLLFEEEPPLMHSSQEERKNFFASLATIYRQEADPPCIKKTKSTHKMWENLLSLIYGISVSLKVKRVSHDEIGTEKEMQKFIQETEIQFSEKHMKCNENLSDRLDLGTKVKRNSLGIRDEIEQCLANSETLKPEFMQQTQIVPYYMSKKAKKKALQAKAKKTAGEAWFNMEAPKMTPELERDLELLKMRDVLERKRFYKKKLTTPTYFQIGKLMDLPQDFYSSRLPKKLRKRTLVEEVMNDDKLMSYKNKRYSCIIDEKRSEHQKMVDIRNASQAEARRKKISKKSSQGSKYGST